MRMMKHDGAKLLKPVILVSGALLAGAAGCNGNGGGGGDVVAQPSGPVATVNGTPIGREELHQYLEAADGESALRQLISYDLLFDAAKKAGVDVSDAQVDKFIADKRKQSAAVDSQLSDLMKSDLLKSALRLQIRSQLDLMALATKDIKVTDADLQKWYNANKDRYSSPATVTIGLLTASTKQRADTMAQQLKSKTKTFAQLVEEQKKAMDPAARESTPSQEVPVLALPPAIKPVLAKMKPGEISGSLTLNTGLYGVIQLISRADAKTPSLADNRTQAESDYRLEKLARQAAAKEPGGSFETKEKAAENAVMQQNYQRGQMTPPSRNDVLQAMCQSEISALLEKLRRGATVKVNDPMYARLGQEFAPTPAAETGLPGVPEPPNGETKAPAAPAKK